MKRFLSIRALVTVLAASAALGAFAVSAGGAKNTQIAGQGAYDGDGTCTNSPYVDLFALDLTGDLVGCLYSEWEQTVGTPSGVYQEKGVETFDGCLADGVTCGTFTTAYTWTAKFGPEGQINGRCQHPITGGTEDFEGITGRLDFKDDVATGIATYRGHIKLPNAPQAAVSISFGARSANAAPASGSGC